MRRICVFCKKSKTLLSFSKDGSRLDGLQQKCKECQCAYSRNHYAMDKSRYRGYVKKRRLRKQAAINKLKESPCVDCGNTFNPVSMDFDHVRGKKLMGVSELINEQAPMERILEEIKKCELVCANCHRIRTAERFKQS